MKANYKNINNIKTKNIKIKNTSNLNTIFAQEKLNEFFFEQTLDGIFFMMLDEPIVWDTNSDNEDILDYIFAHQKITQINDAMLLQYKAKKEEFIGLTPNDFFYENLEYGRKVWREFFDKGHLKIDTIEKKFDGTEMIIEGDYICIYDDQKRILGHFGVQREVTESRRISKLIEENEAKYRLILNNVIDIIYTLDLEGNFTFVTDSITRELGYTVEEILNKSFIPLIDEKYIQTTKDAFNYIINDKNPINNLEYKIKHKDGTRLWHSSNVYPVLDNEGNIISINGVATNITAKKEVDLIIKEQNEELLNTLEKLERKNKILDIITHLQNSLLTDTFSDHIFEDALDKFLEITNSEYGFIGEVFDNHTETPYLKTKAITNIAWNEETKKFYEENAPQGLEFRNLQTLFGVVIKDQKPLIANNPYTHPRRGGLPDGHPPLNAFLGLPLKVNQIMIGMIGLSNRPGGYDENLLIELEPLTTTIGRLIEIQRSKLELSKIEEKTKSIINSMEDIIIVLDKNLNYLEYHLPKNKKLLFKPEQFLGKNFFEVPLQEPANSQIKNILNLCLETKLPQNISYYLDFPDKRNWYDLNVSLMQNNNQETTGLVSVIRNITDHKQREEQLVYISSQMQGINNALNKSTIVTITDLKGNITKVNDLFCEVSGYEAYEVLGRNHRIVNSGYHPKSFWKEMWRSITIGKIWRAEVCNKNKYGELYWVDTVINPILDENGNIIQYLSIRNLITDKKIAEVELRKSEENFRTLFDIMPIGINIVDNNGHIKSSNREAELILGLSNDQQNQRDIDGIEWKILRPDKTEMPPEEYASVRAFTEKREILGIEMGVVRGKNDIAWIIVNATPLPFDQGIIISYQDVTKLKNAEFDIKQNLTKLEQRNDSLQNFAHIVSHNLRSHSANITGLLSLIEMEVPEVKNNEYFEHLTFATNNLMDSIKHLSEVAQLHTNNQIAFYNINLNEVIKTAIINIIVLAQKSNLKVVNNVTDDIEILGERAYLDSIILNFLTNAIKYKSNDRESFVKFSTRIEDQYIILDIEDNGLGIDLNRYGNKIFGMFKTFHEHPESRGIGLFITNNQVKALGGKIEVESKVGIGTKFSVFFQKGENND